MFMRILKSFLGNWADSWLNGRQLYDSKGHAYSVSIDDGVVEAKTIEDHVVSGATGVQPPVVAGDKSQVTRVRLPNGKSFQVFMGSGNLHDDVELSQLLHYYGSHERNLTVASILKNIGRKRQALICGTASLLVKEVLETTGHQARIVTSLREEDFNSYDNGHTILEISSQKFGWHLYDPGFGGWLKQGDRFLSALDLHNAILRNEEFEFVPARFRTFGHFSAADGVDLGFDLEAKWFWPEETVRWYREVFRIFGIEKYDEAGHYVFLTDNSKQAEIVESYSPVYHAQKREDFEETYYDLPRANDAYH